VTDFAPMYAQARSDYDDLVVNDSLGTINIADTMDTEPDDDPEAGGKGFGEKIAE
jgi:hypothetical protein